MKRSTLPLLTGLVVLASGAAVARNLTTPRVRTASRAEIEAVLPASLKVVDAPDPGGEARYARLLALLKTITPGEFSAAALAPTNDLSQARISAARSRIAQTYGSVDSLLREGGLRCPERKAGMLFPEEVQLKGLAKAIATDALDAAKRGDRHECARLVAMNLRFTSALVKAKGVLIDELVAIAAEAIANRSAYETEMAGGLDAKGRAEVLAQMPPQSGLMPELGEALRRDFQVTMLPVLAGSVDGVRSAFGEVGMGRGLAPGTFDGVETARLIGRIDDAEIADIGRPYRLQTRLADKIAAQAAVGLPNGEKFDDMPEGLEKIWLKFKYRLAMNSNPNTIGRGLASGTAFDLGFSGAHRAVGRNLARAAILLRMGQKPSIEDPYGEGTLRFDAKRKLVWSVGENGRDDGGKFGYDGRSGEADLGYPYGDGMWKTATPASRRG